MSVKLGDVIEDQAGLDHLPIGTVVIDVDGYVLTKVTPTSFRLHYDGLDVSTDEMAGAYQDEGSKFLPVTIRRLA